MVIQGKYYGEPRPLLLPRCFQMGLSTRFVQWDCIVRCFLLNCTILVETFVSPPHFGGKMGLGGEEQQVTPTIVPFSVSVLAVVANKSRNYQMWNSIRLRVWLGGGGGDASKGVGLPPFRSSSIEGNAMQYY